MSRQLKETKKIKKASRALERSRGENNVITKIREPSEATKR